MKRAVSVSLGSSKRDGRVEVELLGERVAIERMGTNGDFARAEALFQELDGKVDALSVGGADIWVQAGNRRYALRSTQRLIRHVKRTPVVDGIGLKNTLEAGVVRVLIRELGDAHATGRVLLPGTLDRFSMAQAFVEQGYEIVCGDLIFSLGLPIPLRRLEHMQIFAGLCMPIGRFLPLYMLYPTGERQNETVPRFEKWYHWATVIAGDLHYIKRYMPDTLGDKVIITNTTTSEDRSLFRERGVRSLITTTPLLAGRSFGTNAMEAALTAVAGSDRPLTYSELSRMLADLNMEPILHTL